MRTKQHLVLTTFRAAYNFFPTIVLPHFRRRAFQALRFNAFL